MDGPRLLRRSAECTAVELDGRVSVYNPRTQTVHALSASASAVWHQLDGSSDLDALSTQVALSYALPVEHVRSDVADVVRTLVGAGLVCDQRGSDLWQQPVIVRRNALDVAVCIRVDDRRLATMVDEALADLPAATGSEASVREVTVTGCGPWSVRTEEGVHMAGLVEQALTRTLAAVNHAAVTHTPLLALHAAVLTRHGRALVVPARSGSGKSTLTACLLQHGWRYVSDEALALDWVSGGLVAYPRAMALSPWSQAAVPATGGLASDGELLVRARDLAAEVDSAPGQVRHVVLLERSADAQDLSIGTADRNEALVELLSRGFTHRHDGGRALTLLADLLRDTEVLRLRLGDPRDAAALLTAACDSG